MGPAAADGSGGLGDRTCELHTHRLELSWLVAPSDPKESTSDPDVGPAVTGLTVGLAKTRLGESSGYGARRVKLEEERRGLPLACGEVALRSELGLVQPTSRNPSAPRSAPL